MLAVAIHRAGTRTRDLHDRAVQTHANLGLVQRSGTAALDLPGDGAGRGLSGRKHPAGREHGLAPGRRVAIQTDGRATEALSEQLKQHGSEGQKKATMKQGNRPVYRQSSVPLMPHGIDP